MIFSKIVDKASWEVSNGKIIKANIKAVNIRIYSILLCAYIKSADTF